MNGIGGKEILLISIQRAEDFIDIKKPKLRRAVNDKN